MEARVIISTVGSAEVGENLIRKLLEKRLIACGNLFPKGVSLYHWQGKIERDEEQVVLLKSTKGKLGELEEAFKEHHPYDVPEFVVLTPESLSEGYQSWLLETLS